MNYALAILVALLALVSWHDHVTGKERDKYMKDLATSETNLSVEKGVAKTCSDATVDLGKKTEKKTADIVKAIDKAKASAKVNEKNADDILTSKPDPKLSEIDQINAELNKYLELRGQENAKANSSATTK